MNDELPDSKTDSVTLDRQMHIAQAVFLSLCIFSLSLVVDQTFRWTNHLHGAVNGLFETIYLGIAWCFYLVPWCLVVFLLYRWKKWRRFRAHWLIAPSVLIFFLVVFGLVADPPTPGNRFRRMTKAELPALASDLHYSFSGGGLADYGDQYYFKCLPEDVDRLIEGMKLTPDQSYKGPGSYTIISGLPGCPDPDMWDGSSQYRRDDKTWFYYLLANQSKTEVYVFIGCM